MNVNASMDRCEISFEIRMKVTKPAGIYLFICLPAPPVIEIKPHVGYYRNQILRMQQGDGVTSRVIYAPPRDSCVRRMDPVPGGTFIIINHQ